MPSNEESNENMLSRLDVEYLIKQAYTEVYDRIKYYLVTNSFCDRLKTQVFEDIKDYYYDKIFDNTSETSDFNKTNLLLINYKLKYDNYNDVIYLKYTETIRKLFKKEYVNHDTYEIVKDWYDENYPYNYYLNDKISYINNKYTNKLKDYSKIEIRFDDAVGNNIINVKIDNGTNKGTLSVNGKDLLQENHYNEDTLDDLKNRSSDLLQAFDELKRPSNLVEINDEDKSMLIVYSTDNYPLYYYKEQRCNIPSQYKSNGLSYSLYLRRTFNDVIEQYFWDDYDRLAYKRVPYENPYRIKTIDENENLNWSFTRNYVSELDLGTNPIFDIDYNNNTIKITCNNYTYNTNILDPNDLQVKYMTNYDEHFINVVTKSGNYKNHWLPNPNFTEILKYDIIKQNESTYNFVVSFKDDDKTYNNCLIGNIVNPLIVEPNKCGINEDVLYIEYTNGLRDLYPLDLNKEYELTLKVNPEDSKFTIEDHLNGPFTLEYYPIVNINNIDMGTENTIKVSYSSDEHEFQYNIPNIKSELKESTYYGYELRKENEHQYRFIENGESTEFYFEYINQDIKNVLITSIKRDCINGILRIEYDDNTSCELIDTIDENFFQSMYNICTYTYNENTKEFIKNIYLNDKLNTSVSKLNKYERLLNRINIRQDGDYLIFYIDENEDIFKLSLIDTKYNIKFEKDEDKFYYDYYGYLNVNTIINNKFLDCQKLNTQIIKQTINNSSYILNSGKGFCVVYDKYDKNYENKFNEQTCLDVTNNTFKILKPGDNKLIKFNGLFISVPSLDISENIDLFEDGDQYGPDSTLKIITGDNDSIIEEKYLSNLLIENLSLNNKYALSFNVNKELSNIAEGEHNKYVCVVEYYDDDRPNGEVDILTSQNEHYISGLYNITIKFVPKYTKLKIKARLFTNGSEKTYIDFWNIKLKKTDEVLLRNGFYISI